MKHYEVVAAVIVHGGEVLCMQRGRTKFEYTSYKWEFPGGKVEPGETPEQAVAREIREEMALDIRVDRHLVTVTHQYPDFHITMQCFLCTAVTPDFTLREHNAFRWLPPSQLHTLDWAAADVKVWQAITASVPV